MGVFSLKWILFIFTILIIIYLIGIYNFHRKRKKYLPIKNADLLLEKTELGKKLRKYVTGRILEVIYMETRVISYDIIVEIRDKIQCRAGLTEKEVDILNIFLERYSKRYIVIGGILRIRVR